MENQKNKLYITISDSRNGGGSDPDVVPTDDGKDKKDKTSEVGKYAEHELFHLVKQTTIKSVNFAISNIGNLSGDYITQRKVNEAKQAVSGLMNIGMATVGGAFAGGWVGAIVGFTVGMTTMIVDTTQNEIQNRIDNTKTNLEIASLRDRAGLNTVSDWSRGTEN